MPYKEKEIKKIYYSIGEVAEKFQVNTSLIRFWEKEFDIINPQKNQKGKRIFTEKDISKFQTIYQLVKEKGFTLQGAKEQLKKSRSPLDKNEEVINALNKIKNSLIVLKGTIKNF